jgi:AcrR family transcriptional regulator
MPKLKPATQAARREAILDAALKCFARSGVHRTTIEDICRQAAISPGALYVYFGSKESLIEGLCARDRDQFVEKFAFLEQADDLIAALGAIGREYLIEDPPERRLFVLEMALEATRNPRIAEIYRSMDRFVQDSFEALFTRLAAEGRIVPRMPIADFTRLFCVIGDGIWFRAGVHPDFDAAKALAAATAVIADILAPVHPVIRAAAEATAPALARETIP